MITKPIELQTSDQYSALNKIEKLLLLTGISLRFLFSNGLLNEFLPYTSEGGSGFFKIHPGSLFISAAFFLIFARRGFRVFSFDGTPRAATSFFIFLILVIFYVLVRFGSSGVAYIFDTHVCASMVVILFSFLRECDLQGIKKYSVWFMVLNSTLAIFEVATQTHIMPEDAYAKFAIFRAYSILGHPLLNAAATSVFVVLCLARENRRVRDWLAALLGLAAIMAFGARASFAVTAIAVVCMILGRELSNIYKRRAKAVALGLLPIVLTLFFLMTMGLLLFTPLGERLISMSDFSDTSTSARLSVLSVYDSLNPNEVWWGVDPSYKRTLLIANPDFDTIENFWVAVSLNLGLIMMVPFAVFLLLFLYRVGRRGKPGGVFAMLVFLIIASTNNSLAIKTPLLVVICCLMAASAEEKGRRECFKLHGVNFRSPLPNEWRRV
ncbi:VpsF family polysaccharide biosynthesis protein [Phaeovulum sp. W22_SRMD_FR3]|uniref:VpsF family polysaccharide biosynthesis protein n=1 Tax=Phaeovulum sp. W22_SRMD_FR3 TaxID=3240274 RepID=UPI003F9868DB